METSAGTGMTKPRNRRWLRGLTFCLELENHVIHDSLRVSWDGQNKRLTALP